MCAAYMVQIKAKLVGLQPTVIASRASPPLLEQSSSTVGRKRMRVVQKSERVFYWSRKNAHVISDHGHEAPRVRGISAPTSTREQDSRHWSEIVEDLDNFLKRVCFSDLVRYSFASVPHIVSLRRRLTLHLHLDKPSDSILLPLDG